MVFIYSVCRGSVPCFHPFCPGGVVVRLCFLNISQIIDTGDETDSLWPGSGSLILSHLQEHKYNENGLGRQGGVTTSRYVRFTFIHKVNEYF